MDKSDKSSDLSCPNEGSNAAFPSAGEFRRLLAKVPSGAVVKINSQPPVITFSKLMDGSWEVNLSAAVTKMAVEEPPKSSTRK